MRIVLDTSILFHPWLLAEARDSGRPVVLPAIAVAERVRQLARDGRRIDEFRAAIRGSEIFVEPFGMVEAERLPPGALEDRLWVRHARDALIAAHLREGDELWTLNPRDFEALGVPRARIRGA